MRKWNDFVRAISSSLENNENQPTGPLIEICSYRRVLVERHQGVVKYDTEQIQVKVRYGLISISGRNLQLCKMCKECLVVTGLIDCVSLLRGSV